MYNLTHDSPLYTAQTMILQEEPNDIIELKEKATQGFILRESLCQLLQPVINEKLYMYDNLLLEICIRYQVIHME